MCMCVCVRACLCEKSSIIRSRLGYLALQHGKLVKPVGDENCFFLPLHFALHFFIGPFLIYDHGQFSHTPSF